MWRNEDFVFVSIFVAIFLLYIYRVAMQKRVAHGDIYHYEYECEEKRGSSSFAVSPSRNEERDR
jgi:hypothetical protein